MLQFILAAFVALCPQIYGPPTDQQVIDALPQTDALRTEIMITKSPAQSLGQVVNGRLAVAHQWTCVAFYTEVTNEIRIRRVHVVYLDGAEK